MGTQQDKPNFILVMTDEMRGDCLGCAGHPDVKTPHLDTLAHYGVRFENAVSSCPTCIPARAALHTGMSQERHGRVGYRDRVRWDYPHTLAGELTRGGYETKCCGKMHVHPLRSLQGFMSVDLHDGYLHEYRRPYTQSYENQNVADDYFYWLKDELGVGRDLTDTGLGCNSWVTRPWPYPERYHPTNWVTDRALDFLRRRDRDKPFFLMVSYVRPHAPYDPPSSYYEMYRGLELRPPAVGDWDDREELFGQCLDCDNSTGPKDPRLIREMMAGYYACITHVDHQFGRILHALDDFDLKGSTYLIFLSDHGEMLSDHGMVRKARPYRGAIHIPFIVSSYNDWVRPKNTVRGELVELRDVMPTVLDLAGLAIPDSADGSSLAGAVNGDPSFLPPRRFLHGEHPAGKYSNHFIVTREDKFVWYSQRAEDGEQYFRLDTDPRETQNLIGDPRWQDRIRELRGILIRCLTGRPEGYTDGEKLIAGRKTRDLLDCEE